MRLFNGTLETGVRVVAVLNSAYPDALDINRLIWCDHFVVHTGDLNGPPSLHPAIPGRTGELLVRRRLVDNALTMMRRLHLVDAVPSPAGIAYQASDEAPPFVALLTTPYAAALKERAHWLVQQLRQVTDERLARALSSHIESWAIHFQDEVGPTRSDQ